MAVFDRHAGTFSHAGIKATEKPTLTEAAGETLRTSGESLYGDNIRETHQEREGRAGLTRGSMTRWVRMFISFR